MMGGATIMNDRQLETVKAVGEFLAGTEIVEFSIESTEGRYAFIHATLRKFRYSQLGKAEKGLIGHYLRKMTGYSRQQLTRLIGDYRKTQGLGRRRLPRSRFPRRYTEADLRLLAHTDEIHGTLSGPATKKVLEREADVYGHGDYARLAGISIAHLYNLGKAAGSPDAGGTDQRHGPRTWPSGNGASPIPRASRAICASIQCIREISMVTKASIISMR